MTTPRRLVVLRHAQAEPYAASDAERALVDRGRQQAEAVGRYLADHDLVPDHAAVSSAVRTQQTWQLVKTASGAEVAGTVEAGLYNTEPDVVLDVLRATPEGARTLLYVGHNPAASYLASVLDDGSGDPDALRQLLTGGFPPAALAVFELDADWSTLAEGTTRLVLGRG